MNEPNKKINNQLFSASVTGGTFEEFSEKAKLFPAKSEPTKIPTSEDLDQSFQQQPSGSSVPPKFPLTFEDLINYKPPEHYTPSSGLTEFVAYTDPKSVPLFSPEGPNKSVPPPNITPVNNYRRAGLKKPQYAQPPGLNTSQPHINAYNQTPSIINPQYQQPNFFTPSQHLISSPVMAAIPASEIPEAQMPTVEYNSFNSSGGNILNSGNQNAKNLIYRPVYHHWFCKQEIEQKSIWQPFSMIDSLALEAAFTSNDLSPEKVVPTDGGRFDVNILRRQRIPVYWEGNTTEVRRCSWFHKGNADGKYTPYEENIATKLEEEFKIAFESNQWHRKVELPTGETIVIHGPDVLVLFPQSQSPDAWGNHPNQAKPRIIKRGMDEFDISEGEPEKVDHLLFLVHGIGSVCDLKFRCVEEVVDEFRSISLQLVQSHYRSSCEIGITNRIEVLPISWHSQLHSEATGIDHKLKSITLQSIPRLRDWTNDTLLDILFYTSPCYCQTIISTVGNEMNRVYNLFKERNPHFTGGVSLGGHSLGSLILFDLLCHQHPEVEKQEDESGDDDVVAPLRNIKPAPADRRLSRRISYMMANVGTGQPQLHYPHLEFQPSAFFALGSPIGMFVTVRGLDNLGEQFSLPTCPAFFNIFHPYDPVAYRIESLVNPQLEKLKPVLIPHHKGRKRMHLELKETVVRVGADLKQKVIDSVKNTLSSFYQLAKFHGPNHAIEEEVDKVIEEEIDKKQIEAEEQEPEQTDASLGILNKGRRIDYVLQEAPFEFVNDYIFALSSHVCYWESEDTMLLIIKEIYDNIDVKSDSQIPQQTMTIERPVKPGKVAESVGMDPTVPMGQNSIVAPPPTSGFVRK